MKRRKRRVYESRIQACCTALECSYKYGVEYVVYEQEEGYIVKNYEQMARGFYVERSQTSAKIVGTTRTWGWSKKLSNPEVSPINSISDAKEIWPHSKANSSPDRLLSNYKGKK